MAADLLDQWQQLAGQADQLQQQRIHWLQERNALVTEFEPAAARLEERERRLRAHEQAVASAARAQQERQYNLNNWHKQLQARQARFDVSRADWESERERVLAELRSRDALSKEMPAGGELQKENYHLQWKLLSLQAQRETYERQVRTLTQEVERLACVLIDEETAILPLPVVRAA